MTDLKPFIAALIVFPGFLLLFYGILFTNEPREENLGKFQVIDTYEDCKVIRYTDTTKRWYYFLQCPQTK